jgi:predicted alpha/beta hydrolase
MPAVSTDPNEAELERWRVRAHDRHELELLVHKPSEPRAALLFMCALGVEARYYAPFGRAMASKGFALAMCDLRGNGTSSLRPSRSVDFGYREIVELDIPAAVSVVRERMPGVPLYVGGHSLGGQLMILHLAAAKPPIAGTVLVACAIPYYRNYRGRSRRFIKLATRLLPFSGSVLGYVPGKRLGFGGETEARTLMRDWSHNARTARYEPVGSEVDYETALRDAELDLITVNIAKDEMAPAEAVDFMFEKLPRSRGRRVEARLSEPHRAAHMRWARDPHEVVAAIASWIGRLEP